MKIILICLLVTSAIQGAASHLKSSMSVSSPRTSKIEALKQQYETDNLGELLHHVLSDSELTTHTTIDFHQGEITFCYELSNADILERLVQMGADVAIPSEHGSTPYQRLHYKLTGARVMRSNGPIKTEILLRTPDASGNMTYPIEVGSGKEITCGAASVSHSTLIGNPFDDPEIKRLLDLLKPKE